MPPRVMLTGMANLQVGSVFTPGRSPDVTYNPRDERDLEGAIRKYLLNAGAALTVSGPTKSGKTVVVERLLSRDDALWVSGSDLKSIDDLWLRVIEFLGLFDQVQQQSTSSGGSTSGANISAGVPGVFTAGAQIGGKSEYADVITKSAKRPLSTVARQALVELKIPVVIDDYHYVAAGLKTDLTRAIKGLVTDVPVVMIAVPQDAFRAVREEGDMLGRVWQLEISPWSEEELAFIAAKGFEALNLIDDNGEIAREFARNSLGAPFLMQQLCLDYCLDDGTEAALGVPTCAHLPVQIEKFYRGVATRYVPGVFDALRRGPRTKGQQRLARTLKDGRQTDIYGAVLYGLSRMGPLREITTQQLARTIGEHFVDAPKTQNVASALGHMKTIADESRGASDAAIDYKEDVVYMTDPFLSFYLRFGTWEMPMPPVGSI